MAEIDKVMQRVNCHTRGNKQVKAYSVDDFASAMIELGLYED